MCLELGRHNDLMEIGQLSKSTLPRVLKPSRI